MRFIFRFRLHEAELEKEKQRKEFCLMVWSLDIFYLDLGVDVQRLQP